MAWIESHEEIGDHKKTHFLSTQLKCNVPTAVGYVHLLWHYTLKVAWKDGDLKDFIPEVIARACWYTGEAGPFIEALQAAGFLDGMKVHGWKEYAKHIIYQRKYNEKRRKESTPFPQTNYSRITAVRTAATVPNQTLPNLTKEKRPRVVFSKPTTNDIESYARAIGFVINASHFFDHYEARGWQYKNGQPMKDWRAAIRTWKSRSGEFANSKPIDTPAAFPGVKLKPGQDPWATKEEVEA